MLAQLRQMFPALSRFEAGSNAREPEINAAIILASKVSGDVDRLANMACAFDPKSAKRLRKLLDELRADRKRWWSL